MKRPYLKIYGGGFRRASWIISHMPKHDAYAAACMGGLSVTLNKPPCKVEVATDIDGRVVNAFKVLRDAPEDLISQIRLTPWHQHEYWQSQFRSDDSLEDARRFWCLCWMSIRGGTSWSNGFRWTKNVNGRGRMSHQDGIELEHLYEIADRIKNITFLEYDALKLAKHLSGEGFLLYFDPPYLTETRAVKSGYEKEQDVTFHIDASNTLLTYDGPVIISGYQSKLYADLYEANGWNRIDKTFAANSGSSSNESIWINYSISGLQKNIFPV